MADINNRENRKRELRRNMISSEEDVRKIKVNRRPKLFRFFLIFIPVFLVVLFVTSLLYIRYFKYSDYKIAWDKELKQGSFVGYEYFQKHLLKYSKDGAIYIDDKGNEVWIESYEMKNPIASVNGSYAVVADRQGNAIEIFGKNGNVGKATTVLPISKVTVSDTGIVVAVLEDADSSYISFFSKEGNSLDITIKTNMSGNGYPVDISLSPDGSQLIVGYQYIEGGELKGRVVFYDFSEIGKNIPNRLVGGFDEQFKNSLIGRVRFIDSIHSFAASGSGIYFFSSKNLASPELIKQIEVDKEILSIAYSDEFVGVITKSEDIENPNQLDIYDLKGKNILSKKFNYEYRKFSIDGNNIFLYADSSCRIYNLAGVEKFAGDLGFNIANIRKGNILGEYIFTGITDIKSIRLR